MNDKRVAHEVLNRLKDYFNFKKTDAREWIRRALLIVCVITFVFFGYDVGEKWYNDYKTRKKYDNITKPVTYTKKDETILVKAKENIESFNLVDMKDFSEASSSYPEAAAEAELGDLLTSSGNVIGEGYMELLERNEDVIGFIEIKDTNVQYNVVQHKVDNEYYLKRDIDKQEAYAGIIYMDYRNRVYGEDKNIVLYGHNMKDGSMFRHLHRYKEEEFAKSNIYITFDTIYESMTWEVFAAYKNNLDRDFSYTQVDFSNDEEYAQYLASAKKASLIKFDAEPGIYDRILTLSTCDSRAVERFTVQAVLVSRTKR